MDRLKFIKPIMTIEKENADLLNSRFIIQRLVRGYGITIGNSLRRVLLSSLPGAAIVNVQIEGITHEFSVIPGIYEDVMSIILNLKKVVVHVDSEDEDFEQKLFIDVHGEQIVTAAHFQTVDGVCIINKEQVIAHLSKDAHLKMSVTVRRGIGYKSAEENKIYNKKQFGVIAIDSLYTPVVRVTYHVEQKLNNKEELILDIETNNSINAKEALATAAKILVDHFNVLVDLCDKLKNNNFIYEPQTESYNHALDLRIDQLELSVRLFNSLKKSGINTVKELVNQSEKSISKLNSLGKKSFEELKKKMKKLELQFKL
ncbi:DNA-directed RNA polymerase subunit alpha [Candidatus Phytoplasma phoenicium]|uniref:DNA-directed RNA polymerase subunit alpha n=1 Tax=Candidatus Phytoplasma phoenicium TaxID=198422 RepID=A0A0L0MKF2_9MOLU|nr:DNA-directed RNA polymerase subunit alpha [Candidatus Phytoplasma phoenicium]KND62766.1 DNA-directed RNA polymerase alpha subunit [Candidatus Phytoplasma phoenicium]